MALSRVVAARQCTRATTLLYAKNQQTPSKRWASTESHDHGHGHGEHAPDTNTYAPESFATPVWRNTFLATLLAYGAYKFMPSAEDRDSFFARLLSKNTTSAEVWQKLNEKHLELALKEADDKLTVQEASLPKIHRLRYPGAFEQASPHCIPVGSQANLNGLTVRAEH